MSGIYQRKTNSATAKNPNSNQTLISVDETGKIFTKDSSGNVTVYPTTGGGGSFTGGTVTGEAIFTNGLSANTMSSSTLNVNYSDAFTFGVDENFSQSITEYIGDFGGWVPLPITGTAIGNKIVFANNEIYGFTLDGNASIPAIPGASFPVLVSGQYGVVNDGILSGSTVANGLNVFDQSAFGGDVAINNAIRTIINNTLSGSNISYEVGTGFQQNDEYSELIFSKINEAGEDILLVLNDSAAGLNVYSTLTDPEAELFRIVDDGDGNFIDRLLVRRDNILLNHTNGDTALSIDINGVIVDAKSGSTGNTFSVVDDNSNSIFNVDQTYGVTVNAKPSSTGSTFNVNDENYNSIFNVHPIYGVNVIAKSGSTEPIFNVNDNTNNIIFSVQPFNPTGFSSQVDIFHDGKSDAIFRILDSEFDNYMYVSDSGSTSFNSSLSGTGQSIFSVGNDVRTALQINDINTTFINDPNLFLSKSIPTSSVGLSTGQVFTQTSSQLGGTGSTKVLCIV